MTMRDDRDTVMDEQAERDEQEKKRRKRVNRMKRSLIFWIFFLTILSIFLSLYLLFRLLTVEKKLDGLLERDYSERILKEVHTEGDGLQKYDSLLSMKAEEVPQRDAEAKSSQTVLQEYATSHDAEREPVVTPSDGKKEGEGKKVYLTFDDGPSPFTNQILDILKEKNVKATFFVVAHDTSYQAEMNRIVTEGHTIGMHSMSHKYKTIYRNLKSFEQDVDGIHNLIFEMTGVDTKFYRFPGGSSNEVSRVSIDKCIDYLNEKGYVYYDWNAMNDDATGETYTASELNQHVMEYVRNNPGDSIVLLHDLETHESTVEALPKLIDELREKGYTLLPITSDTPPVQHHTKD